MKSWDTKTAKLIETPKGVVDFINDIINVYKKHGFSISHEDIGGSFKIEKISNENIEWLRDFILHL